MPPNDAEEATPEPPPSRIKRNTACTSCRDAKVRCNPNANPQRPCQRCTKLELTCVVDKTHKRISRRSKLDELVQEVQNIKQAVATPLTQSIGYVQPQPIATGGFKDPLPPAVFSRPEVASPLVQPGPGRDIRISGSSSGTTSASPLNHTPATSLLQEHEPSLTRTLGSVPFSGEDIDFYFQKYFEHFHPYFPIVRVRDPNKLYEMSPLLFWAVILVSCRRYARNSTVLPFLVDTVKRDLYAAITEMPPVTPSINAFSINAFIVTCAWSFPDIRFLSDPTALFTSFLANTLMAYGLHTGRGSSPEFSFGMFQNGLTDEEATYAWSGYSIVAQRVNSYHGLPPFIQLFTQTVQKTIDGKTPFEVPQSFRCLLECQRFCNRVSKTMAACLEDASGIPPRIVDALDEEFDSIRGLLYKGSLEDIDRLNILIVKLETQIFYMSPAPGYDPDELRRNILRTFKTAQAVMRDALDLDRKTRFLHHMPHYYFRSLLTAGAVIYKLLRSSYMEFLDGLEVEASIQDFMNICKISTIIPQDLPARLLSLLVSWNEFNSGRHWSEPPVSVFPRRLGSGLILDVLRRWKHDLQPAGTPQPTNSAEYTDQTLLANSDLLQSIDWSFMDDFVWNLDANPLPPIGP